MKAEHPKSIAEWIADHIEEQASSADGWVYFIRVKRTHGAVKIGYTKHFDVEKRRCVLQIGNPYRLEVAAVVRGSREIESMLHRYFMRWRLEGEWFAAKADELLDLISELQKRPQQSVLESF